MDAVEYVKTLHRLCKSQDGCFKCILDSEDGCIAAASRYEGYENTVQIVEQWAKDHPVKTRKREFLKLFPDAEMVNIERTFCVAHFEPTKKCKGINPSEEQCIACMYRFWNDEVTDNGDTTHDNGDNGND